MEADGAAHQHVSADGVSLTHAHCEAGQGHSHGSEVRQHEHMYPGGLRVRHTHSMSEPAHVHGSISCDESQVQLFFPPPRNLRGRIFPSWIVPHPIWHVLPVAHIFPGHAKAHFDSSGAPDILSGALTLITQGLKLGIALSLYTMGNSSKSDDILNVSRVFILASGLVMLAAWCRWCSDLPNNFVSNASWLLYMNGWMLSVNVLFDRLDAAFSIPRVWGLLPSCGPPLYIFLRTALFFPSAQRRKRFLLAALSNRSMPIALNMHVVGPEATWRTHQFLVMLNVYTLTSTGVAKVLTFAVAENMTVLDVVMHMAHLVTTAYACLLGIRLRQLALDVHAAAKATEDATIVGSSSEAAAAAA